MRVNWDVHALAPAIVITATIVVVLIADFFFEYRERFKTYQLAAFGTLLAIEGVRLLDVGRFAAAERRRAVHAIGRRRHVDADAEDDPAPAVRVEARDLLGEDDRMAQGRDQHADADYEDLVGEFLPAVQRLWRMYVHRCRSPRYDG